jgi:hypothetical protein
LWLGVNAFAADDLDRPIAFDHLICDGINTDGGYVLASRVSVDFPESDLVHTGSSFSRHRRSTASGDVAACASEASNSQPASRVQILSGHYNTAVRVPLPLQLRESEMFDFRSGALQR